MEYFMYAGLTHKCDALQQNREQVKHVYFETWAIEVGIGVKNDSSFEFEDYVFYVP